MPEPTSNTPSDIRVIPNFSSLDEVVELLHVLHRDGYHRLGNWNLAQTCEHLNDWMCYMMDGYPVAHLPIRMILGLMRISIGKSMLKKILLSGKMAAGGPTLKQTVHAADRLQDATSLERLEDTIRRLCQFRGSFHASPVFGPLSATEGLKLQLIHCAHHLSFLVPAHSMKQPS